MAPVLYLTPKRLHAHYTDRIRALEKRAQALRDPAQQNPVVVHVYHDDWCPSGTNPANGCLCNPDLVTCDLETGKEIASDFVPPADPAPVGKH